MLPAPGEVTAFAQAARLLPGDAHVVRMGDRDAGRRKMLRIVRQRILDAARTSSGR